MTLDDMDYTANDRTGEFGGFNEYYRGILENGDILWLKRYGYYDRPGDIRGWEWAVYVPEDFPVQWYAAKHPRTFCQTAQDALDDFGDRYEGRSWRTVSEQRADPDYEPTIMRCEACGWEGDEHDIESVDVREDFGDYVALRCPSCGRIEYDGMELFVPAD